MNSRMQYKQQKGLNFTCLMLNKVTKPEYFFGIKSVLAHSSVGTL